MAREYTASVALVAGDVFTATTGSGGQTSLKPVNEVEPVGALGPMETVLVALGGCLGMSIAPILRKMRQPVTRYEIRIHGAVSEPHPRVFEAITVEHVFAGDGLDLAAVERAVLLGETRYCGVSAMLSKAVPISNHVTLLAE